MWCLLVRIAVLGPFTTEVPERITLRLEKGVHESFTWIAEGVVCGKTSDVRPLHKMSHNLNFLRGLYRGLYRGVLQGYTGVIKGDTRSLDYSSNGP